MIYKNTSDESVTAMEDHRLNVYDPVLSTCVCCGSEIYPGDLYYDIDGDIVCRGCIREKLFDLYSEDYLSVAD